MNKPKKSTFKQFNKKVNKMLSQETRDGFKAIKIMIGLMLLQIILGLMFSQPKEVEMISPYINSEFIIEAATPSAKPKVDVQSIHTGIASYYSRAGCVGCSPTMTMANGQPLDDNRLTVAFNRSKLNSKVRITNEKTGDSVIATVTDTGGFEKEKFNVNGVKRIVDLTIATRDAINCSNLCGVKVEVL